MVYIGLRANGLYLPTAPNFFIALPTAGTYLREIVTRSTPVYILSPYADFRHQGSVWAILSKLNLSAAPVPCEAEHKEMKVWGDILNTSRFLRSAPLASTHLVGRMDNNTYESILKKLLRVPHDHQCATMRAVASEVQLALEPEAHTAPALPKPSVDRRNDLTMLAAKIIEDPDFPIVPPWHKEFSTLRPWFDVALALPEDCSSDIFAHDILVEKVFKHFNKKMVAPTIPQLRTFRFGAAKKVQEMIQAEADAATIAEPARLLQIKIKDLIPEVAKTEEENKALRKVSLSDMNIPRILKYCERSIILLLTAKMRAIMRNSKHVAGIDDTCICDIISQYSDDEGEEHFNSASAIKNIFPQRKRTAVLGWASSIEAPAVHHIKLSKANDVYCAPLEPLGEANDMTEEEGELQIASDITWELQFCSLIFPRGHDGEVLLGYGYQADQEVSEGHFTNMISAASASDTYSKPSADEDESEKATSCRNSDTSLESSTASIKDSYDYPGKRLAMASTKRFNKCRINSIQKAWDVPHRAHSPDQSGYRSHYTKTHPASAWKVGCVSQAQLTMRDDVPGLLEEFNANYEAKHVAEDEKEIDKPRHLFLSQQPHISFFSNSQAFEAPYHHQDEEMFRIVDA